MTASRAIGQETVRYVANVYKYYVAYKLSQIQRKPFKEEKLQQLNK